MRRRRTTLPLLVLAALALPGAAHAEQVVQRGSSGGASVEVYDTRKAAFSLSPSAYPVIAGLVGPRALYGCFKIRSFRNPWRVSSPLVVKPFSGSLTWASISGGPPFDGCVIRDMQPYRWRDGRGTHDAVEIALSRRGGIYFRERAAARELALFARSARMMAIRAGTARAPANVARHFGARAVRLASATGRPPLRKIGFWSSGRRVVISKQTPGGRRLFVEFNGRRVHRSNVSGLVFVV